MDKQSKKLLLLIGGVVVCFVLIFFLRFIPTGGVVTIDDMHRENLEGESNEDNYVYNGFSFVYVDDMWYTQAEQTNGALVDIPLHFGPKDLEYINVEGEVGSKFRQPEVYITFDPVGDNFKFVALSSAKLSTNIYTGIGAMPIAACSENATKACANRPILTCENKDKAIIYLKKTPGTASVKINGSCVEISGNDWELVKATERFILLLYGIMP